MHPDSIKQRVQQAFDRAAPTYDGAAVVQRRVGDRLLAECNWEDVPPKAILDAGCGTGYGAGILRHRWPQAHLTGVDFAPAMLEQARSALDDAHVADIEHLPFAAGTFDLWWSSLSIQWCDARAVFSEAARVLRPGGRLAVSTLCPDTFAEVRTAFSGIDGHRHTLTFNTPEAIGQAMEACGFRDIRLIRERHTVHYPDLKTLLRSIKEIGAQNVGQNGRQGMLGRAAWQQVEASYEQFRTPAGLPASYDVLLGYARR